MTRFNLSMERWVSLLNATGGMIAWSWHFDSYKMYHPDYRIELLYKLKHLDKKWELTQPFEASKN